MQPVFEGGCDAKVAAAASHAPEEITVLRIISLQQAAVGGDDINSDDVVQG